MESGREEKIGSTHGVRSGSSEYHSAQPAQSHLVQQNQYQLHQHAVQSDSPPPQLCVTTSTPTSTETAQSRLVTEGNQQMPNSAHLMPPLSAHAPISSSVQLRSMPSDQSASWQQPPSPLIQARTVGSPSGLPESDPAYDQGDSRYNAASFPSAVKLLVSNNVAGSIIGRSGQTISDLQSQSATRIKLSQADDYYPGTQDRVCLVQGQADNVKRAVNMLLTRLYALQQQQHYHHFAWQRQQQERGLMHEAMYGIPDAMLAAVIPGFSFVVRILVPIPCCGMIIGKGGTNIKQMVDASGVSAVRLSPKEGGDPDSPYPAAPPSAAVAALVSATAERVVSITGPDLNSCLNCLHIILDGMTSHPDISRYANMTTSYSRVMSAVSHNAFHGSQAAVAGARRPDQGMDPFLRGQEDFAPAQQSPSHGYLDRQTPSPHLGVPPSPSSARGDAMGQFVSFGGQPTAFLPQDNPSRPPLQPMQNSMYLMPPSNTSQFPSGPGVHESLRVPPSHSAPDLLALHMQNSLRVSDHMEGNAAGYPGASSFTHQIPQPTHSPPGFAAQVAIPDNLIGSILGRGGRTLNELQVLSNTRIRISQRGEYLPGTKTRVVTIRGPSSQSVSTAQYLMNQRMVLPPSASTYMERPPEYGMAYQGGMDYPDVGHPPL